MLVRLALEARQVAMDCVSGHKLVECQLIDSNWTRVMSVTVSVSQGKSCSPESSRLHIVLVPSGLPDTSVRSGT